MMAEAINITKNEDAVTRLKLLLEKAEKGEISDYVCIWLGREGVQGYSHSYRSNVRLRLLGLLFVMLQSLSQYVELESQNDN